MIFPLAVSAIYSRPLKHWFKEFMCSIAIGFRLYDSMNTMYFNCNFLPAYNSICPFFSVKFFYSIPHQIKVYVTESLTNRCFVSIMQNRLDITKIEMNLIHKYLDFWKYLSFNSFDWNSWREQVSQRIIFCCVPVLKHNVVSSWQTFSY